MYTITRMRKVIEMQHQLDDVNQFKLTTPYDVSTLSLEGTFI